MYFGRYRHAPELRSALLRFFHEELTSERARKESFVVYLSISVPAFFGVRKEREYIGGKKNESKNRKGERGTTVAERAR